MFEQIVSLLGGRVSEQLDLDDISTGASNDIERASAIARQMVTRYGMSDRLGPVLYGGDQNEVFIGRDFATQRDYSESVAAMIDEEIRAMIDKAYAMAEKILSEHEAEVRATAEALLEKEHLTGAEFEQIFNPAPVEEAPVQEETPTPVEETPAQEEPPAEENNE